MSGLQCSSRPRTSLLAAQPPPLTCAGCATPYYQIKKTVLFTCSPWHSYLPQCGHPFLLSLMACTYWFQLILPSFGWYVIPAEHHYQKNLSRNLRIDFSFSPLPDHTLSYLWPMTNYSYIGWIQVGSAWAFHVLHFLCTSKACPLLMRLPWSKGSSMHFVAHSWPLMA